MSDEITPPPDDWGFSIAPSVQVIAQKTNIDNLLRLIGVYVGWGDDISRVFVTDKSSVSDFGLDAAEITDLATKLGFPIERGEYLVDIAVRMNPPS